MSDTRIPLHTRTIRMDAVRVSETELEVTGHVVDDRPEPVDWFGVPSGLVIHDMRVTLRVRHPDLVVTAASAAMDTRPYTLCTDAVDQWSHCHHPRGGAWQADEVRACEGAARGLRPSHGFLCR